MFAAQRVQWASASVSLSDFLGGKARENSDVLLTIKTNRTSDATMLRSMLEQLIEFGVNSARFMTEQTIDNEDYAMPVIWHAVWRPITFSFAKGFLRTLLPDVEGDRLIFRVKHEKGLATLTIGSVGSFIFLPVLLELAGTVPGAQSQAQKRVAFTYVKVLEAAVKRYTVDVGQPPTTEQGFAALLNRPPDVPAGRWGGPYIADTATAIDPWGNPYQYVSPGRNNRDFEIWSRGPDGLDHTEDDIGSWMSTLD